LRDKKVYAGIGKPVIRAWILCRLTALDVCLKPNSQYGCQPDDQQNAEDLRRKLKKGSHQHIRCRIPDVQQHIQKAHHQDKAQGWFLFFQD
jgi:hypothetical protein